ncbi:OB-fold protein [Flavobacterium sp.]
MTKALKISAIIILMLALSFFSIRYYINNAGKRDIASETTTYEVSSKSIFNEFTLNGAASNMKYLEKPVSISGVVTSIHDKEITLDNSVNCTFLTSVNGVKANQNVTVKGRVIGFDDLLGEVKLDQCSIYKK